MGQLEGGRKRQKAEGLTAENAKSAEKGKGNGVEGEGWKGQETRKTEKRK
jgi:hypothetical protein